MISLRTVMSGFRQKLPSKHSDGDTRQVAERFSRTRPRLSLGWHASPARMHLSMKSTCRTTALLKISARSDAPEVPARRRIVAKPLGVAKG